MLGEHRRMKPPVLALARTAAKIVDWAFVGLFKAPVNAGNSASEFAELANFARFLAEPRRSIIN